jgi:hypothetical protein
VYRGIVIGKGTPSYMYSAHRGLSNTSAENYLFKGEEEAKLATEQISEQYKQYFVGGFSAMVIDMESHEVVWWAERPIHPMLEWHSK